MSDPAGQREMDREMDREIEIASAILDSFARYVGGELVERSGDPSEDARRLRASPTVVLSHDGGPDPVFVYANDAAARRWETTVDVLVGMPSRLSAAPDHREDRSAALAAARLVGVYRGYRGERQGLEGTRFEIVDAVLWTVDGYAAGPGQAAAFDRAIDLD
jgi:PAS domain-containing protein